MKSYKLLEKVIKSFLLEAKTFSNARTENLNLHQIPTANGLRVILYKTIPKNGYKDFEIYGTISLSDQRRGCSSWRVASVASERGYGALMYDIGMSLVAPDYIRADDLIRPMALSIWKGIAGPHSSKYDVVSYNYEDEENEDFCYTALKPPIKARIKQPLDVELLADHTLNQGEYQEISKLGFDYFGKRYRETK